MVYSINEFMMIIRSCCLRRLIIRKGKGAKKFTGNLVLERV